ncbi:MAG TPA: hypothetical protein VFE59_23495 [Trebonia sp.]|nr:hypothetical protein [Trebonia sp.]
MSTSDHAGTRRFSDTCADPSGMIRSNAAAKITRVDDRDSVPTHPKNHKLISRIKITWNTVLCTSHPAIIAGYGKTGSPVPASRVALAS